MVYACVLVGLILAPVAISAIYFVWHGSKVEREYE